MPPRPLRRIALVVTACCLFAHPASAALRNSATAVEGASTTIRATLFLPSAGTLVWQVTTAAACADAEAVRVMCVDAEGLGDLPGADIAAHLARHGVTAEADHVASGGLPVAEVLISSAADMSADLIVMGGYGHSRVAEIVLGGVTRRMMASMPVPVLMSH